MPVEVLSGDCLENNIIKCFSVVLQTQSILGLSRTTIKDRAAITPNKWHNFYSFVLVLCANLSCIYFFIFYYKTFYHINKLMFYACSIGTASQFLTYFSWMCVARFANKDLNVMIYYTLQKIDRILNLARDDYYTDFQATVQNRTMMLICVFFPLAYTVHVWGFVDSPMSSVFFGVAMLSIYVDFVLFGGFLYYIAVRISIFNKMLKNLIEIYENESDRLFCLLEPKTSVIFQLILKIVLPSYDRIDRTLEWNRWSECIQEILKSYETLNEIFNFQMMNLTLTTIIWSFIGIAAMLVGYRSGLYPLTATVTLAAWDVFYATILIVGALLTYWVSSEIKETKMLCIRIMSYNNDGDDPYQKAASKMLRIIHNKNPKFVVYGIFELNTSLPLTVMGIIASNILVVIQFIVSRD